MGAEAGGPRGTAPGQQLRALFYALAPGESSFRTVEEVPDYVEKSIPFFITFIGLEFAVSWIQKRKLPGRINDGISSLSLGILSRLPENNFEGKKVIHLEYEAYTSMAETEIRKICRDVRQKWPSVKHIAVHHRLGVVPITEASVIIAVSSPHRAESLEAVMYCINTLKASVPIWKKEIYEDEYSWKENKECFWANSEK